MVEQSAARIAILAYPGASAYSVFGPFDEFRAVERLWAYYNGEDCEQGPFRPEVVTVDDAAVEGSGGVRIEPTAPVAWAEAAEVLYIPSLLCDTRVDPTATRLQAGRFPDEVVAWVRRQWEAGSLVAAMCSGVFLLAETGLLNGRTATTHWAFADTLRAEFPAVRVDASAPVVVTGPKDRIVTGGAAAYSANVTLYLISRFSSPEAAHRYAKASGFFCQSGSQNLVARHLQTTRVSDAQIADALAWLADHLDTPGPVAGAAEHVGLSARTFARRFQQATGTSPIKYLQRMRVEQARRLLELGELAVEDVGAAVGYNDVTAFRRLFRREVGLTPADYRRSFRLSPDPTAGSTEKGAPDPRGVTGKLVEVT